MINDLGVDPYEWFDNPLDSMPIAREEASLPNVKPTFGGCYNYEKLKAEGLIGNDLPKNMYAPPEKLAELESMNPRPEEEIAEWFADKPDESDEIEKEKTIHHKMYEIATSKYNPFAVGGSESIQDLGGGSEIVQK